MTSLFEKSKSFVRKISPRFFVLLKGFRQYFSEREILLRLSKFDLKNDKIIIIFTWTPGSFRIMKKLRAKKELKLVLWLGEPPIRDITWEPKLEYFDTVFAVDEGFYLKDLTEANRARFQLLPLASDDTIFYPLHEVPEKYKADIAFVGKYLPSRARSLERFKNHNIKIYGYGWDAGFIDFPWLKNVCKGGVPIAELNFIYNGAKVAIGTLGMPKDPYTTSTQRTFDIGLTGTFQVCEEVRLTRKLFGDAVGIFDNDDELQKQVEYALSHEEERKARGAMSRQIALQWTYNEDAKKILRACGEKI